MPSFERTKRIMSVQTNNAKTIGQIHKENADFVMENTWTDDIQSKECYIYDYAHDDSPTLNSYIEHTDETTKTKIDAKFIITSYGSVDKDQVAYHLMFKPSQKLRFEDGDELYYYETDYVKRWDMIFPVGMYCDIPDDRGIYHRWLIVDFEEANQFVKYQILPCEYRFQWISVEGNKRYKRQMWCAVRGQNSYTSGLWSDSTFTTLDDVNKVWLPLNDITDKLHYLNGEGKTQRTILSAKTSYPLTWKISKIENSKPIGILKVTTKEDEFNPKTDYIEKDDQGYVIGMWADYYSADKTEPIDNDPEPTPSRFIKCELSCTSPTIKAGGSYRTLTARFIDPEGNDVSDDPRIGTRTWDFFLDSDFGTDIDNDVEVKYDTNPNIIKVKVLAIREYFNHYLVVNLRTHSDYTDTFGSTGQTITIIG